MGYNSQQPEQSGFECDFTPDEHTSRLTIFTPDNATVSVDGVQIPFIAISGVSPNTVPEVSSGSDQGNPSDPPTVPSDYYLHTLNIVLTPGQTYHLRVDFDNTLTFDPSFSGFSLFAWGCYHDWNLPPEFVVAIQAKPPFTVETGSRLDIDLTASLYSISQTIINGQPVGTMNLWTGTTDWKWNLESVRDETGSGNSCALQQFDPDKGTTNPTSTKLHLLFTKPGKYTITVNARVDIGTSLGEGNRYHDKSETYSITVNPSNVAKVTFDKSSLRMGMIGSVDRALGTPNGGGTPEDRDLVNRLNGYLIAYITPANTPVTFGCGPFNRVTNPIEQISTKTIDNTRIVELKIQATAATSNPDLKDSSIQANGIAAGSVPITVIQPTSIYDPGNNHGFPSAADVYTENVALGRFGTTPADFNANIGFVRLWTLAARKIPITILDQFGKKLDDLYQKAKVRESVPNIGNGMDINVRLGTDGSYVDLVGGGGISDFTNYAVAAQAVIDWKTKGIPNGIPQITAQQQTIEVAIAGMTLIKKISRTVTVSPISVSSYHIIIDWPSAP